jgi:hypothetical protein
MSPQFVELHIDIVKGTQGLMPHLWSPPPPHTSPPVHVPQSWLSPPQPSGMLPQSAPTSLQVFGVQTHVFDTHNALDPAHGPQSR